MAIDVHTKRDDLRPRHVGDTWTLRLQLEAGDLTLSGVKVWCTVKLYDDDPDPGLLQADSEASNGNVLVVIDDALNAHADFVPALTAQCPANRRLHYDWKIEYGANTAETVIKGRLPTLEQQTEEVP